MWLDSPITITMWYRYYVHLFLCFCHIIKQKLQTHVTLKVSLTSFGNRTITNHRKDFFARITSSMSSQPFLYITCFLLHITFTLCYKLFFPKSLSLSWDQILGPALPLYHYVVSGSSIWFSIYKIRIPALAYFTRNLCNSSKIWHRCVMHECNLDVRQ